MYSSVKDFLNNTYNKKITPCILWYIHVVDTFKYVINSQQTQPYSLMNRAASRVTFRIMKPSDRTLTNKARC